MRTGILALAAVILLALALACGSPAPQAVEQPAAAPATEAAPAPPAAQKTGSSQSPAAQAPVEDSPEVEDARDGDETAPSTDPNDTEQTLARAEEAFPAQASNQVTPGGGSVATPDSPADSHGGQPMVDVQPGQEYQAGTRVNFPTLGISFDVPQHWIGGIPQGSSFFVMGSNTQPGLVVVMSHQATSNSQLVSLLGQPLPLDDNVVLRVEGQPRVEGSWIKAGVSATDGFATYGGYLMALVRQQGGGIVIVAAGPPEQTDYYRQLTESISTSVGETAVSSTAGQGASGQAADADSSPLVQEWDQFLRGKRLTYLHSYSSGSSGGYSTHYELDLCSDGSFFYYDRSHVSVDTGGAFGYSGGTTTNTGQWRITTQGGQIVAEMRWQDGQTGYSLLEYVDNKTYVDGARWFVTSDNASCH
jgi:hypothetical protein